MTLPQIIQGGMGVAVSDWKLARAVSIYGQLGVVSGTLIAVVLVRRLQLGDTDGHMRRAISHFPIPEIAERILKTYFIEGGKPADAHFKEAPMPRLEAGSLFTELVVLANFVEVFLAKEGHAGIVGINLLEKVQIPTLPSLYGAMLAGVDYVLMGAGIPRSIPGVLDNFARGEPAELRVDVSGSTATDAASVVRFDPAQFLKGKPPQLTRPRFMAVVSSATLAMTLARKSSGRVDGFVVENESAGGHNAPPRGQLQLSETGEPVYGARDMPDFKKIAELSLPFWIAGSCSRPGKLAEARSLGAAGIQVGTPFAFCEESGFAADIKRRVRQLAADWKDWKGTIFTDPKASPTGFPFKVVQLGDTLSELAVYAKRVRICNLGYLREAYKRLDGTVGYRCAAEAAVDYIRKKGEAIATEGRKCLCNALLSAASLGQVLREKTAGVEPALVTAGNDIGGLARFMPANAGAYSARDVLRILLSENTAPAISSAR